MATNLERSLQQGRDLLSTYENKLVIDDTVPEDLRVVDRKKEELLVSVLPCLCAAPAQTLSKAVVISAQLTSLDLLVTGWPPPAGGENSP